MRLYALPRSSFIVPTLPRGNASGDAPASRFSFVGTYRPCPGLASGVGR
jgi:hypothetical protein